MPDTPSNDLTLGEIHRNLLALRMDFKDLSRGLEDRPDWKDLARVEKAVKDRHDVDIASHASRIAELQDNVKWGMRLVVTSLAGLLINIVYTASQTTQGM